MRPAFITPVILACAAACAGNPAPAPATGSSEHQAEPADSSEHPPGSEQTPEPTEPTAALADLQLGTLDGAETRLDDHRAQVTVIALWASFCAPCIRELPLIEALHNAYSARDDVAVLLVSIDDFAQSERDKVARIVADHSLTVPAFIDHTRQLLERVAPRDAQGKPHYTVPMLVVLDDQFRLRRELDLDSQLGEAAFIDSVKPLVDAALRGEPPPPDEPYQAPLGTGYTRRSIKLTVPERLREHQIIHYLKQFRSQLQEMYPDLDGHQVDELMRQIEAKLRAGGGSFEIEIPQGHNH